MLPAYALVIVNYNHNDRIQFSLSKWRGQSHPPAEIIIVDDGSDEPLTVEVDAVLYGEHTANLGKLFNAGIDACNTPVYFTTEPSLLPVGRYFAEKQLRHLRPGTRFSPYCYSIAEGSDLYDYEKYFPRYGKDGPVTAGMFRAWTGYEVHADPERLHGLWLPAEGAMTFKSDFLRYNETYITWGSCDLGHNVRLLNNSFEVYRATDCAVAHWEHPRTSDFYKRAATYEKFVLRWYREHGTTLLTKDEEREILEAFRHRA